MNSYKFDTQEKTMNNCNQRALVVSVVVLSVTTAALVGVLVWRETRTEKLTFTSENLEKTYPSIFRNVEQQRLYMEKYIVGHQNRTIVNDTISSVNGLCQFNCNKEGPLRRRRQTTSQLHHGCCVSSVLFVAPGNKTNIFGNSRTLMQFEDIKQYFAEHQCQTIRGCTGCICSQENNLHTAVVLKSDIDDAEYIEDTELDFFYFDGCCKCLNT